MVWPNEAFLNMRQIATPASRPQVGGNLLYVKDDGLLYLIDADGTETAVGGTSTGTATTLTPLVTVVDGVPGLVFDGDGEVVYTEVPS